MIRSSGAQLTAAQPTADELAGLHAAGIPIAATNPPVTQKELGMNAYTSVTKTADDTAFSLTGVASRTKYIGDTRDCVGHTWINYWATGTTPASLGKVLATFTGAGVGNMTIASQTGEPYGKIEITGSTTNPDFTAMSLTTDDYIHIIGNTGAVVRQKLIHIYATRLDIAGLDNADGLGSAMCISPKYLLSNSSDIIVAANQDIYFKGFRFNNTKIIVYGKATFENCIFDAQGITVTEGGEITFVGYCNTFYNISSTSAIRVLRDVTMAGQVTVMKTLYADPGEFKMSAIQAHTGAKIISTNSRSLWTAFGIVAESGANIVIDNYIAIKTYRDGLASRGGHIYGNNVGLYRGTSGYCAWNLRGSIHIPNCVLHNEGSTLTYEVFSEAIDDE